MIRPSSIVRLDHPRGHGVYFSSAYKFFPNGTLAVVLEPGTKKGKLRYNVRVLVNDLVLEALLYEDEFEVLT